MNLSPGVHPIEKLVNMLPMRQVVYASILQVVVFGFMFGTMALVNLFV